MGPSFRSSQKSQAKEQETGSFREFLKEVVFDSGQPASNIRLVLAARLQIAIGIPTFSIPIGLYHYQHIVNPASTMHAVILGEIWLGFLALHLLACFAVAFLPLQSNRLLRMGHYASLVGQLTGLGILIHAAGALVNPIIIFLPFLISCYRIFLDYHLGLFAAIYGSLCYVFACGIELLGILPPHPYFPGASHPLYHDLAAAWVVVAVLGLSSLSLFSVINFAVNQTSKLHRYITESVLRRYLPPSLVEKASRGHLKMDWEPERRQVTVLFIDLVGFTAMSEKLGAEAVGQLLNHYLSTIVAAAHRYGATVDKFVGDAVMLVFGAPDSLELAEQADRSVRLALELTSLLEHMDSTVHLQARIGINTGEVIVGNFGSALRSDFTAIGPAVNLAARLEAACRPGGILIGEATAKLLGDEIVLEKTEALRLKGISQVIYAYSVVNLETNDQEQLKNSA